MSWTALRVWVSALALAGITLAQGPFRPFDLAAFESHASLLGASEKALESFRSQVAAESAGAATDGLLRSLSPEYAAAVQLAEDGAPRAALALARILGTTEDRYLRAHARYHLGRVLLDGDDPASAAEVFAAYMREDLNTSALDAEVLYFYGRALADVPMPKSAVRALRTFLERFPDAPTSYVESARRRLSELAAQADSPLHEIADVMKGVERRIRKTLTGQETQERQQDVMRQLEQMIAELEEQEKEQSSGGASGANRPQEPASSSAAESGQRRIGNLGSTSRVVDRWGELQDREREAIESELQTKLPERYRKMLKGYYRKLGVGQR